MARGLVSNEQIDHFRVLRREHSKLNMMTYGYNYNYDYDYGKADIDRDGNDMINYNYQDVQHVQLVVSAVSRFLSSAITSSSSPMISVSLQSLISSCCAT